MVDHLSPSVEGRLYALEVLNSLPKSNTPQSHSCPLLSATFVYGAPRLGFAQ